MGSPLSGALANIFLCLKGKQWVNNCPDNFKPIYHKRYVDDPFLIFKDRTHANTFLDYVNSKHPKIKFTMKTENNNELTF